MGWEGGAGMNNSDSFWQKIKLNLFCSNVTSNKKDESQKAWKHRIAVIIGKLIWIIIDKIVDKFI